MNIITLIGAAGLIGLLLAALLAYGALDWLIEDTDEDEWNE